MITITEQDWQGIFIIRDELFKEMTGLDDLYPSQKEISNRIIKSVILNQGKTLAFAFTRQFGKTTTIARATIGFLLLYFFPICKKFAIPHTQFFHVGFFAPRFEQARTGFDMLRAWLKKCEELNMFDFELETFNGNTITLISNIFPPRKVYCFTANPASHIESKTLNLIVYDEGQDMDDKQIDKAIAPMGARTNATSVFIGVAGYRRCKFHQYLSELSDDDKIVLDYVRALEEEEIMFTKYKDMIYLNYKKHIKKRIHEMGVDSQEFKTQYRMIWVLEAGQFITYEALVGEDGESGLQKEYVVEIQYPRHMKCYAGIDWGKKADSTILTVVDMVGKLLAWYEWQGDEYYSQIEDITRIIQERFIGCSHIYCDGTSNQDMAVDTLRGKLREKGNMQIDVQSVNFSINNKDYMYKNLSKLMHAIYKTNEDGEKILVQNPFISIPIEFSPEKDKFIRQFLDLQKDITGGKWNCKHPDGVNYHDDYCDSVALACLGFAGEQSYEFRLA